MSTSERATDVVPGQSPPPPPRAPSFTQAPTEMVAPPLPRAAPVPLAGPAASAPSGGAASRTGLWIAGGAVALLVLALLVGGMAARRWVAAKQIAKAEQKVAEASEPLQASQVESPPSSPAIATNSRPADAGSFSDPGERFVQAAPPAMPAPQPAPTPTQPTNEPVRPAPSRPAPVVARPEAEPPSVEPEAVPEEPAEEVSEPAVDRPAVTPQIDRMMVTGMALSFVVEPPEAIVKIDNRVIGQAGTWNAKKRDGRAYDLPEGGDHLVRIIHEGRTTTIRVSASPEAPSPTLISVDLRPPSAKGKKRRAGERP